MPYRWDHSLQQQQKIRFGTDCVLPPQADPGADLAALRGVGEVEEDGAEGPVAEPRGGGGGRLLRWGLGPARPSGGARFPPAL